MRAKVTIDLEAIRHNAKTVIANCAAFGADVTAVTKMHRADLKISKALVESGIKCLADSRIENLRNIVSLNAEKWLLRIPAPSVAEDVVRYSDLSLNSEISTIRLLNEHAERQGKIHKIMLMWDLGDLREGYFDYEQLKAAALEIKTMSNVALSDIGTNLSCYGGVMPTAENLTELIRIAERLKSDAEVNLRYISGGNSTSYSLVLDKTFVRGVNNLRIGDTIYIGRDMQKRTDAPGMKNDAFVLSCEIAELKEKPSVPVGERGYAALNVIPEFEDKGIRKRALCSVGRQDIDYDIEPFDAGASILGASSDHLIVDVTDSKKKYKIGDILKFKMKYTAVMRAFTSHYVDKEYVNE